jgi:hypothetical protein
MFLLTSQFLLKVAYEARICRKIVDVFTVAPWQPYARGRYLGALPEKTWRFLSMLRDGDQQKMQGELAVRVATS